jgi:hypothetical protein
MRTKKTKNQHQEEIKAKENNVLILLAVILCSFIYPVYLFSIKHNLLTVDDANELLYASVYLALSVVFIQLFLVTDNKYALIGVGYCLILAIVNYADLINEDAIEVDWYYNFNVFMMVLCLAISLILYVYDFINNRFSKD